jgi:ABC-type Fe3+-hydroxamate transport system substrate-binding protein
MKQIILFTILSLLFFQGCAQEAKKNVPQAKIIQETSSYNFQLSNYLEDNNDLDKEVNRIFSNMDDTAIVAQLIMPAVGRL